MLRYKKRVFLPRREEVADPPSTSRQQAPDQVHVEENPYPRIKTQPQHIGQPQGQSYEKTPFYGQTLGQSSRIKSEPLLFSPTMSNEQWIRIMSMISQIMATTFRNWSHSFGASIIQKIDNRLENVGLIPNDGQKNPVQVITQPRPSFTNN